jgi:hypothetical protein
MNWYILAKQGSKYETYARNIASWVLQQIKANHQSHGFSLMYAEDDFERKLKSVLSNLYFSYKVTINDQADQVYHKGAFSIDPIYSDDGIAETSGEPKITIDLVLPSWPPDKTAYNQIYNSVLEVVRHELEHFTQYKNNYRKWKKRKYYNPEKQNFSNLFGPPDSFTTSIYNYLTQPTEISAWVSQMYLLAKKRKVPFYSILREKIAFIKQKFITEGVSVEEAERTSDMIGLKWQLYAEQRYPKAL